MAGHRTRPKYWRSLFAVGLVGLATGGCFKFLPSIAPADLDQQIWCASAVFAAIKGPPPWGYSYSTHTWDPATRTLTGTMNVVAQASNTPEGVVSVKCVWAGNAHPKTDQHAIQPNTYVQRI